MKLHTLQGYIQNIFLAEYHHGLLLLDGCSRADVGMVKMFIEQELKRPASDLKLVIVTHMHPDHAGGAHKFRKVFGCQIAAANVEGHWYRGLDGVLMHWTDLALTQWVAKRRNRKPQAVHYPRKLNADILLDDGDLIPGFEDWQVLFTQGHTDRDLSLYHRDSNQVYIADLLVRVKGKLVPPFPVFYPRRYRDSLHRVQALPGVKLLMAHGPDVSISAAEFDEIIDLAPTTPTTHWRSIKSKFKKAIS
ncbi:MBL fold metallo-hydrolase [Thalassotalea mangrovi]|uniref:MBL fold metallo-hydrolase n=1 Tax=Thalassotalea mangrovi TaxID=2572245 RepID=A0A4U1B3W3_9GAMM|nr:MBL fold metallo-hydrolase [Thalassotalea mangrovi]TKB44270.1 MBL fold metallo-hydrolase [Thalassotalea mangrovi]